MTASGKCNGDQHTDQQKSILLVRITIKATCSLEYFLLCKMLLQLLTSDPQLFECCNLCFHRKLVI